MRYPVLFGRHLLLERINVGGMAEVFKAKVFGVEGFERIVAIKRILPAMAEDQEFISMFIDEARIASKLTHQNIVQILELGACDGAYFISMEYVPGRDLRHVLDDQRRLKTPLAVPQACFIMARVCEALEYAHRKKDPAGKDLQIIHRDISPQNVILSYEGEVKLCDFGIVKAASRASRTQAGVLKGKFAYMSPEQVRGHVTDRRSDLFALGVVLYEALTGERLFLGESDYSTLEAVRDADVPEPTQFNPALPPSLVGVIRKLLARDPKDRYQWAAEVYEDLQDHSFQDGRIYHSRQLRKWMQECYAAEIELEDRKLEEFEGMGMKDAPTDPGDSEPAASPGSNALGTTTRTQVTEGGVWRFQDPDEPLDVTEDGLKRPSDAPEDSMDSIEAIDPSDPEITSPDPPQNVAIEATRSDGAHEGRKDAPEGKARGISLSLQLILAALSGVVLIVSLGLVLRGRVNEVASLRVSADPPDAKLWVDGELIGSVTPAEVSGLALGAHQIELERDGYDVHRQSVIISEKKAHAIAIRLEPLTVPPREESARASEEPPPTPVDAGEVQRLPDASASPVQVGVRPEQDGEIPDRARAPPRLVQEPPRLAPEAEEGFLVVSTKPPGLAVSIDGKSTGLRTPIRRPYPLAVGTHVITFEMEEGRTYSFDVVIAAGATTKLRKPLH